ERQPAAVVLPADDRPSTAIGGDGGVVLEASGGAERATVDGPGSIHCAGRQHVLRVDVEGTAADVLPGDDRPAGPVADDRLVVLLVDGGAERAAIRGPSWIHRT